MDRPIRHSGALLLSLFITAALLVALLGLIVAIYHMADWPKLLAKLFAA